MKFELMSFKNGSLDPKKGMITVKALFFILTIFVALFSMAQTAEAAGTPAKIIAFTDKKEYMAWWMDAKTTTPGFNKLNDEGQSIFVYAVVLDDDGNIMKGRNIQVIMNDTVFDHWDKGNWNVHNAIVSNNTYFKTTQTLNDTGTFNDSIANDGMYTSTIYMNSTLLNDVQTTTTPYKVDNQIRVKLYVRDISSGLNTTTYVLVTGGKCHQSGTTNHPAHVTSTAADLCTDCHQGYEHFFENVSGTIPDEYLDIHFKKNGLLPDSTEVVKGMQAYNWNSTQFDGLAPYGSSASWRARSGGGALYCRFCHKDPSGSNWYDYGNGDRTNLNDRPSCARSDCHATTEIEGTAIIPWSQGGAVAGNDTLRNINNQKSHNRTTTANVSCTICHAVPHGQTMPNMSADISAGGNINAQCWYCHNISGGLNITSNGGSEVAHSSNDCKACHYDGAGKLDSHLVPTGQSGGMNCTSCHNIGGSAGYDVNFTAINRSMHGNLNNRSNATGGNATNKPCWACHGTKNGTWANQSDQPANEHNATYYKNPRRCQDCHTTGTFNAKNVTDHIPSGYNAATDVNTSSYNNTYCSYCHNNSVNNGNDSFMGLSTGDSPMNASVSHYGANKTAGKLMNPTNNSTDCVYCHRNTSNMVKWGIIPGSLANLSNKNGSAGTNHNSYTASSQCSACHGSYTVTAGFTFHNTSLGSGSSGGADCKLCHDAGGSAGAGKLVNFSAMNDSGAIHKNLNNGTTASVNSENRKCWACHGNGSQPGSGHPANYDTPYNCTNCHIPGSGQNFNYSPNNTLLNVTQHYLNGTSIRTPAATNCYLCHNRSEMMMGMNLDPDGAGTVYGGVNGGNNSTSHYGKNRTDLRTWNSSRAVNCSYCHQNASTAFSVAMIDPAYNRSIQNHSAGSSPVCFNSTCHGSGWIHNSTLTRPSLPLPNSTYCQLCHPAKQKHNGTQDCTLCHINTSSNDTIHPIKYLQMNGSFITSNSSAVNCSNCHQGAGLSGFGSAPRIPNPLDHSSNISNGTIWGSYWTTGNSSCYYCHSNTKHNSTALGNISALLNSYNVKNGSLTTTQWCADCHYNDSINTDFKGSLWYPAPPYISYDNTGKSGWINHSSYFSSGYNDSVCKTCHALNGSYAATSLNYSHSLDPGTGGNPNCISCHNLVTGLSGGAPSGINFTAANSSVHNGTNSNNATAQGFVPVIGSCWACHDSDGNVTSGHPDRYKNPRTCTECHIGTGTFNASAYNAIIVSEHFYGGAEIKAGNSGSNISSCINCHENISEMVTYNNDTDYGTSFTGDGIRLVGGNRSFYHYGADRSDLRTWNASRAVNCSYCHQNASTAFAAAMLDPAYNRSIQNHSAGSSPVCFNSTCHDSGWIHNSTLKKPSMPLPNSTYCLLCHPTKQKHNGTQNCTLCHINTSSNDTIHPIKYLIDNGSFGTTSSQAVTCSDCHQSNFSGFSSAPIIPAILKHSSNASNGTIWGTYWGAVGVSSQNNTNVSQEVVTTGTTSGITAAQTADGTFETMNEADTGGAPLDQYTNVSSNTTTNGTITSWANMQSASDGGAYATLTEAGTGGGAGGNTSYYATSSPTSHTNVLGAPDNTLDNTNNGYINGSGFAAGGSGTITKVVLKYYYSITSYGAGDIPSLGYRLNSVENVTRTDTGNVAYVYPNPTFTVDITSELGGWTWADVQSLTLWHRVAKSGGASTTVNVDAFEVNVTTSGGTTTYSMNITTDTASVPAATNHYLEINYSKTAADNYDVYVFNGSAWNNRGTLNSASWTLFNYSLTGAEYNSGNPRIKYIDQNSSGTTQGNLYIDYQRIHSVSSGSANYSLDIRQNVTGIPAEDYYYLTVRGKTDNGESYDVMVYDSGSGWVTKTTINSGTSAWYNTSLSVTQISGGKVQIRYVDTNISSDTIQNTLSIDYAGVRSENSTAGISSCYYCHGNTKHNATALGTVNTLLTDPNNTRGGSLATTTYCVDCHYNDPVNTNYYGNSWDPIPPLITTDNTGKGGWINHSTYLESGYKDEDCRACHALNGSYLQTSLNYSHSLDPGVGGGPNCITCHNLVTGLSGGAPVGINFTAANTSSHNGTNSNNATQRGFVPVVGTCWACHDSDGNVTSGHPDRYKNPKTCTECHIGTGTYNASSYNALIVAEHYSNGTDIKAGNSTTNLSSCINCHENVSEMILYNNDADYGSFIGDGIRLVGGNMSFYHYGKNRSDLRAGNSSNCSYCHQNASTVFASAMINSSYNRSIGNHSNYSSNPGCTSSQCHNTGWIHNSTLTKSVLSTPNSTFCLNCHGKNSTSGLINFTGAITSIKEKHNNSVNCSECHMETVKDVHPVKYLQQDATYSTLNTSAVNCITCHQTTSVDSKLVLTPPKIPSPMHHSDNSSNGTIWNYSAYWTPASPQTSCTYCHNDTKHNASALGRPAGWQGNNVVNSSLTSGTWCSSCHYKNYSSGGRNYSDMTQSFTSANLPVPPEITNGSYAIKIFNRSNYYNHSLTDYGDSVCKLCHGANLSATSNVSELMHNVTIVNTCTGCHYSFEAMNNTTRPDRYVDFSLYNTSLHRSLSCTDCHTRGHKNMGARKACEDCHAVQADPVNDKDRHNITPTPGTYFVGGNNVVGITDCTTCHNSVLYNKSISTYGYWKPKDCDYCHTYPDKYYE